MSISEIAVISGGSLSLVMALFHSKFYSFFGWEEDFKLISKKNSKIYYTIHIALLLLFVGFGFISLFFITELSQCRGLSLGIMVLFSMLWLWRTIWQVFYFQPKDRQRRMPALHYVLILFFGSLFISYTLPILIRFLG